MQNDLGAGLGPALHLEVPLSSYGELLLGLPGHVA